MDLAVGVSDARACSGVLVRFLKPGGLGADNAGRGKAGRSLSYVATVQGNGNLLVGKAYTAVLDLLPGDEFEIKLGKKQIRLVPVGGSDDEE
ncbi:hypothetical protein KBZ15_17750 [Cyanobium sp. BA20m-p-22]|nr:hypothetical protein [Cyanobium sp. BA20m-p-22]